MSDYNEFVKRMGSFDMDLSLDDIGPNIEVVDKEDIFMESLAHHGVLGMKWGVRRYQNKDGTLTSAGKKRTKKENHPDYTEAHTKKKVKQMSSSELRNRNTRLQMENQYSQLKRDQNLIVKGSSYVATTAAVLGTVVTLHAHSDRLVSLGKKFVGAVLKK